MPKDFIDMNDHELMVRISWYYYKEGLTQSQIAKKFNTNRMKVMKILEKALSKNVVEIKIKDPYVNLLSIEKELVSKYNLEDAVVVPVVSNDKKDISKQLGMAASQYIQHITKNGDVLGIGWGQAVSNTIRNLSLDHIENFYIVSLSGGMLPLISEASFFSKYSSNFKILPAPLLVSNEKVAEDIFNEPEVKNIRNLWDLANHLIVGIGSMSPDATILKRGYLKELHFASLKQKGAVGDILGQYFDKDGNIIDFETNERIISFDVTKLKEKQNVIAVAGGENKTLAIRASIKAGYVKTLIVDENTAKSLLSEK
jgi:DNA-binding transcriptional regulator LsrR (DeoR family)